MTHTSGAALDRQVQEIARATILEANRALEGALAALRIAGIVGDGVKPRSMPLTFVLKLAACVRLYEWEEAGLARLFRAGLPTWAEVWEELLHPPRTGNERFPGRELAAQVFAVRLEQLAWRPPTPASEVVVAALRALALSDGLAELLFSFRHLVDEHRPVVPGEG